MERETVKSSYQGCGFKTHKYIEKYWMHSFYSYCMDWICLWICAQQVLLFLGTPDSFFFSLQLCFNIKYEIKYLILSLIYLHIEETLFFLCVSFLTILYHQLHLFACQLMRWWYADSWFMSSCCHYSNIWYFLNLRSFFLNNTLLRKGQNKFSNCLHFWTLVFT